MSEEEDVGQLDITDEMIAEGRSYSPVSCLTICLSTWQK